MSIRGCEGQQDSMWSRCTPSWVHIRSVLIASIRKAENWGSRIPDQLFSFMSNCPLKAQISQGLGAVSPDWIFDSWLSRCIRAPTCFVGSLLYMLCYVFYCSSLHCFMICCYLSVWLLRMLLWLRVVLFCLCCLSCCIACYSVYVYDRGPWTAASRRSPSSGWSPYNV